MHKNKKKHRRHSAMLLTASCQLDAQSTKFMGIACLASAFAVLADDVDQLTALDNPIAPTLTVSVIRRHMAPIDARGFVTRQSAVAPFPRLPLERSCSPVRRSTPQQLTFVHSVRHHPSRLKRLVYNSDQTNEGGGEPR